MHQPLRQKIPHTSTKKLEVGLAGDSGSDRPWVQLSLAGRATPALIDTGASRTLVSSMVSDKLPNLPPLSPAPRLVSVTGDDVPVLGETFLDLGQGLISSE